MPHADVQDAGSALVGSSAEKIVSFARDAIGNAGMNDGGTAFVWGVSSQAGIPFPGLQNTTVSDDLTGFEDDGHVLLHSPEIGDGSDNDGWTTVSSSSSVSILKATLLPGDVVCVYQSGNAADSSDGPAVHTFVISSVSGGNISVIDDWNGSRISEHDFDDIVSAFAPDGSFNPQRFLELTRNGSMQTCPALFRATDTAIFPRRELTPLMVRITKVPSGTKTARSPKPRETRATRATRGTRAMRATRERRRRRRRRKRVRGNSLGGCWGLRRLCLRC